MTVELNITEACSAENSCYYRALSEEARGRRYALSFKAVQGPECTVLTCSQQAARADVTTMIINLHSFKNE